MEKRYDVFISYSTQDQKVVEGICGFLEREGYRCFVAYRDIPRGVVWATAITNALDASKMMVVVFSGAFNVSKQTDREIEIASENDMPILTFRVAEAQMTGAKKYYLKNLNWIDAFPNPESYFGRLHDSVVRLIGSSKIKPDKPVAVPPQPPKQSDTPAPKNKKTLWIVLGAVAALVLLLVLLWPKPKTEQEPEPIPNEPTLAELDTKAFQDCRTVADYRHYIAEYGQGAQHYAEAKGFIDRYVADSLQHVVDSLAQSQAQQLVQQQIEAEAKAKAEAERKEDEAYRKCTTISGCNSYLRTYPNGRYSDQVRAKKAELEQKQAQQQTQQQTSPPTQTELAPSASTSSSSLTITANGVSFVMKRVAGGTFQMGSNDSEADNDEQPVHSVTVSTFYMGETEVTQALWKAVMGSNPSNWQGDDLPVERVSWNDIQDFIRKLNQLTGRNFRLPTEAEWEFAARGGNKSNGYKYAGSNSIGSVAWYADNSGNKTHAVKGKNPNELGLYDMSGNVWEWCGDWYGNYGSGSQTNPKGASSGSSRVLRGGSWLIRAGGCRVSNRSDGDPDGRSYYNGFRLCLPQ